MKCWKKFEEHLKTILQSLEENNVEFVVVGEMSAYFHGWKTVENKLEICYSQTKENTEKIVHTLNKFSPRLRNNSENQPFNLNIDTLQSQTFLMLSTKFGFVDLLVEVAGVGNYDEIVKNSEIKDLYGMNIKVLTLDGLIKAKRAAGRTKDLLVLPELEALQELLPDEE